jgi:hypothetical protein
VNTVLTWERDNQLLKIEDEYALNAKEEKECNEECECVAKLNAGGRYTLGTRYKYRKYFDESRNKTVYVMYVPRIVESNEQITRDIERKLEIGYLAKDLEQDYPEPKRYVRKDQLVDNEWKRYFRHVEK